MELDSPSSLRTAKLVQTGKAEAKLQTCMGLARSLWEEKAASRARWGDEAARLISSTRLTFRPACTCGCACNRAIFRPKGQQHKAFCSHRKMVTAAWISADAQSVTQRSQDRITCFYQTLTWLLQRGLSQHLWEQWRRTARSCCSNPPSMTLRTAPCVISFYWMTLNKGSRSSCDGCTRSFNRLTWTNNYPLQFRENNQKKKKEKESKCLRTHPILNLFKLL